MDSTSARSKILEHIQAALQIKTMSPDASIAYEPNLFVREHGADVEIFEQAFKKLQGNFIACENMNSVPDCLKQLPPALLGKRWCCKVPEFVAIIQQSGVLITEDIMQAEVVVTDCECLVARTGSVVLSAAQSSGRALPVYAPVHITIATISQLVYDTENAISFLLEKYSQQLPSSLHFVAGPSRTGDIEKTLVMGVHGPKDVFVLLVKE